MLNVSHTRPFKKGPFRNFSASTEAAQLNTTGKTHIDVLPISTTFINRGDQNIIEDQSKPFMISTSAFDQMNREQLTILIGYLQRLDNQYIASNYHSEVSEPDSELFLSESICYRLGHLRVPESELPGDAAMRGLREELGLDATSKQELSRTNIYPFSSENTRSFTSSDVEQHYFRDICKDRKIREHFESLNMPTKVKFFLHGTKDDLITKLSECQSSQKSDFVKCVQLVPVIVVIKAIASYIGLRRSPDIAPEYNWRTHYPPLLVNTSRGWRLMDNPRK